MYGLSNALLLSQKAANNSMKQPCPASISGACLEMVEGFFPCPDDDCYRTADSVELSQYFRSLYALWARDRRTARIMNLLFPYHDPTCPYQQNPILSACTCGFTKQFECPSIPKPPYSLPHYDHIFGFSCQQECDPDCEIGPTHCWNHHRPNHKADWHDPAECDQIAPREVR